MFLALMHGYICQKSRSDRRRLLVDTFQRACELRAERGFIACSQSRIIDAQPPRGNMGHQDELQARGGRPMRFLTACLTVCERVEIMGVWGLLVGGV